MAQIVSSQLLLQFLDPAAYGKGNAKTWDQLIEEVESGDCTIELRGDVVVRTVQLVSTDVYAPDGDRLFEAAQKFTSGRTRHRNRYGIAEKLKANETVLEGFYRGLQEELKLDSLNVLKSIIDFKPYSSFRESDSYPGLTCEYTVYNALAWIDCKRHFIEVQPDKTTYFEWHAH